MFYFDLSMKSTHLKNSRKFKTIVKGEEGAENIFTYVHMEERKNCI